MNILLLRKERQANCGLERSLSQAGWWVEQIVERAAERYDLADVRHDVIVLDQDFTGHGMPQLCRALRRHGQKTPVIAIIENANSDDKVACLKAGADDALDRAAAPSELAARINALKRRTQWSDDRQTPGPGASYAIRFDSRTQRLMVRDKAVELSPRERDLAQMFLANHGCALARDRILNAVWGAADTQTNVVDVYVNRLRKKLGGYRDTIETLRDFGYRFEQKEVHEAPPICADIVRTLTRQDLL